MITHHHATLFLVTAASLSESMSSSLLFPFIYYMVRDFGIDDVRDIGSRAGMITSSFFFAQFVLTTFWGLLSDKFGRKPVLLLGLLGNSILLPLFGTSQSFKTAIIFRSCCGLINGNLGVIRTTLGELVDQTDITHSRAFSLLGIGYAMGGLIGPLLGGFLARPDQHNYVYPCIVGGAFSGVVFILSIFFLQETNVRRRREKLPDRESTPLLPTEAARRQLALPYGLKAPIVCVLVSSLLAFNAVIFDETFPIYAATKHPSNAGFGMSPKTIATILSSMGFVVLASLLVLFPLVNRKLDTRIIFLWGSFILTLVYPFFSLTPGIPKRKDGIAVTVTLLALRYCANSIIFTSINILTNCSIGPEVKGLWTGISQAAVSLLRACGPLAGGFIWSWSLKNGKAFPFDHHFLFLVLCLAAYVQFVAGLSLSKEIATKSR